MNDTGDRNPVRLRRIELGMTQADLAARANVSVRTVHNIEAGRGQTRVYVRRRILRALRLPFDSHAEVFGPLGVANHNH